MSSVQFLINKELGKYEVTEHIGHGGMAEVYLGHQRNLERKVAIKVLHPFLAGEQGFVSRFQREARIVATMRHPNIVQVYDFDYHEELDIYYMVMEFIEGATLKDRLKAGALTAYESAYIAAAIADALDYAHRREMVHRDIKPANIMFTEDGDPVLADFGIARMLSLTGLTASGAMVGTPAYMAPEIGQGQPGSAASDIYSLGVVFYEMITGQLPFEADIPMSLVMKHINDPVPSPKEHIPDLPDGLEEILMKALAKEPEKRYVTAGKMAKALRRALDSAGIRSVETQQPQTSTPAEEAESEEQQPLLRVWSNQDAEGDDEAEAIFPHHGKPWVRRLQTALLLLFALLVLGGGGWLIARNGLPPALAEFLPDPALGVAPELPVTLTASPTAQATPEESSALSAQTVTPTLTATLTPTPTQTLVPSAQRAEVLRLYANPSDEAVSPGTNVLTYITLRNGGEAPWPEGTRLVFVRGEKLTAPSTLELASVAVGEQIQVFLPLTAPDDIGTYLSVWEVQLPDGHSISSQIQLKVVVQEDLPTVTPTATFLPDLTPTSIVATPLKVLPPQLKDWQVNDDQDIWIGTLRFAVEGGVGDYRLYQEAIRPDAEIRDLELTFQRQKCEAFPLKIIATSGEETAVWEGEIPYPEPEACNAQP